MPSTVSTAPTTDTPEAPVRRVLDPSSVHLDAQNFVTSSFIARMQVGMQPGDITDPSLWSEVQRSSRSLKKLDSILAIGYDESWMCTGVVTEATRSAAVVHWGRLISAKARIDGLFSDENYKIAWTGQGYQVRRKSDEQAMSNVVSSETEALILLRRLYPSIVA